MSTEIFFCEPCNKVLLLRNQLRHVNSKTHHKKQEIYDRKLQRLEKSQFSNLSQQEQKCQDKFECLICVEEYYNIPVTNIKSCKSCKQSWCMDCDKKLYKCPFCRTKITGRGHLQTRAEQERFREEQRVIRQQLEEERQLQGNEQNIFNFNIEELVEYIRNYIRNN